MLPESDPQLDETWLAIRKGQKEEKKPLAAVAACRRWSASTSCNNFILPTFVFEVWISAN